MFAQRHRVIAIVWHGQPDLMLPDPQRMKALRQLLEAARAHRSGAVDQRHEPNIRPFPVSTNQDVHMASLARDRSAVRFDLVFLGNGVAQPIDLTGVFCGLLLGIQQGRGQMSPFLGRWSVDEQAHHLPRR